VDFLDMVVDFVSPTKLTLADNASGSRQAFMHSVNVALQIPFTAEGFIAGGDFACQST
jgi:hypothetical protein